MTISAECTVCTDQLTNDDIASACPCGHVFHQGCLDRWLSQCANQPVCPMCRAKAPRKSIVRQLFFNAAGNTSICSQDSPNAAISKLRNQISTLQTETLSLRGELAKANTEREELKKKMKLEMDKRVKVERKLESKLTQFTMQKNRCDMMKEEVAQMRMREDACSAKLKRLDQLEKNKELLAQLSSLAEGEDTTDYVDKLTAHGDIAGIKRYNDQIQRAFQSKCADQRRLEREVENLRRETARNKRVIGNHEEERVTLQVKLKNAEKSLEAVREKNKIITDNLDNRDTTMFNRLITESPLSDDLLARARNQSTFATPNVPPRKRRSDEKPSSLSKSIKLESPLLFESPWSDESGFEAAVLEAQKEATSKVTKVTKPRKIEDANVAMVLSSEDEEEEHSPVISRTKPTVETDNLKPQRVKVKLKRPKKDSPIKRYSNLDVSKLVKESSLFQPGNSRRFPNGLGGSSKPVTTKLKSKNKKTNIADFFKNTKMS